jgi:Holliday junction resolvase RusA-like endonuclease
MPKYSNAIKFTAYGIPQTKGSTKAYIRGGRPIVTNDNPKAKEWQRMVAWMAQTNRPQGGIFTEAVLVRLQFFFVRPKSIKPDKRPHHTVKPDIDKATRCVLDALKGTIYQDDSQVIKLLVSKEYGPEPCVMVEVREVIR